MRLFIAVPLPTEIADRAAACLPAGLPGLKAVRPDLLHITLAFLGWLSEDRLAPAADAAQAVAKGAQRFTVILDRAGRFPASGPPRTIWLGAGAGKAELERLAAAVQVQLRQRGFGLEDRAFTPHLTLARVRPGLDAAASRTIRAAVDGLHVPVIEFPVDRITVVQSELSPKGPRYTARAEAPIR